MASQTPKRESKNISKLVRADRLRCIFSSSPRMKFFSRLKWRYVIVTVLLLAVGSAGLVFWRAQRAFKTATVEVQSQQILHFSIRNLAPVNTNFEWINAPEAFTGAAAFKGEFIFAALLACFAMTATELCSSTIAQDKTCRQRYCCGCPPAY
jgi:hypothetical protein